MDVQTSTQASFFWFIEFSDVMNEAMALDDADDDEPTGAVVICWFVVPDVIEFWQIPLVFIWIFVLQLRTSQKYREANGVWVEK